ncbi:MAG: hypothetical protein LBF83_03320 [Spirochaetaceae bacterium]|jgi:hypothetical protein|nr:hypothetical protein [Spirochaetaceae bacterium]
MKNGLALWHKETSRLVRQPGWLSCSLAVFQAFSLTKLRFLMEVGAETEVSKQLYLLTSIVTALPPATSWAERDTAQTSAVRNSVFFIIAPPHVNRFFGLSATPALPKW